MCGEKTDIDRLGEVCLGSPPRVRGKACDTSLPGAADRITPACAGKRIVDFGPQVARQDHPRVCGEKKVADMFDVPVEGSPPRVRGKARHLLHMRLRSRITPACAGKSHVRLQNQPRERDHPRVCGEK